MESAMHIKTKVLPGNKIEVTSPNFTEGEQVEVIVVFPSMPHGKRRNVLDLLNAGPPPHIFTTVEEADRYLEGERESWDH